MENAFYALAARMRNIRRWGLMRNSFEENNIRFLSSGCEKCVCLVHF